MSEIQKFKYFDSVKNVGDLVEHLQLNTQTKNSTPLVWPYFTKKWVVLYNQYFQFLYNYPFFNRIIKLQHI